MSDVLFEIVFEEVQALFCIKLDWYIADFYNYNGEEFQNTF